MKLGSNNDAPETWKDFKKLIGDWCTSVYLNSMKRYLDEPWSKYLVRLQNHVWPNEEAKLLKKNERRNNSMELKIVILSKNANLKKIIEISKEIEERKSIKEAKNKYLHKLHIKENFEVKNQNKNIFKNIKKNIYCFYCKEKGHRKFECTKLESKETQDKGKIMRVSEENDTTENKI